MFEKLRDKPLASSQERFETLIGRTTQIYGRLVLLDSVRIDGKVVGNIETHKMQQEARTEQKQRNHGARHQHRAKGDGYRPDISSGP